MPYQIPIYCSLTLKYFYIFVFLSFCFSGFEVKAEELKTHTIKHLFDISSSAQQELLLPADVAVSDRYVYIVNSGLHNISVYNKQGRFIRSIGVRGSKDGEFNNPLGIGLDVNNQLYVADKDNHRIQIFDQEGRFLRQFPTRINKQDIRPVDVAVDTKKGNIYVTENNNHGVAMFSSRGKLLDHWGRNGTEVGEFRYPAMLAVTADNEIAVVDVLNTRVQVFSKPKKHSITVGEWGVLPGQLFRPKGIAIDKTRNYYISDSYMGVIQVYADTGHFIYVLGRNDAPYRFKTPTGIAVDKNNRLYVAEMLKHKVSVFELAP